MHWNTQTSDINKIFIWASNMLVLRQQLRLSLEQLLIWFIVKSGQSQWLRWTDKNTKMWSMDRIPRQTLRSKKNYLTNSFWRMFLNVYPFFCVGVNDDDGDDDDDADQVLETRVAWKHSWNKRTKNFQRCSIPLNILKTFFQDYFAQVDKIAAVQVAAIRIPLHSGTPKQSGSYYKRAGML